MRQEVFIKKFSKTIQEGNAAVFAGAGTSVDAGFVNWKKLVAPFATEIGLDIEKETDLIGLTQLLKELDNGNKSIYFISF